MRLDVVIDDDVSPTCDRPTCDELWPGAPGRELPGGFRLLPEVDGRRRVRLFCSPECADADRGGGAS